MLEALGSLAYQATALTKPGLDNSDPDRASGTLDGQAKALEACVIASPESVVIVAHSGANASVTLVLDRHSDRVLRVI